MADEPRIPDIDIDIPAPRGLQVTTERPYHILLISDFTGSEAGALSGALAERVVDVSADSFDGLMSESRPSVSFTTADPLSTSKAMVEISLRFDALRAFDPRNVLQQLPATKSLIDVRERIVARLRGNLSASQLSEIVTRVASADPALAWLSDALKPSAAPAPAEPGAVDDLLNQLDLGGESGPAPKTPVGSAIASAARHETNLPAGEAAALRRTLAEIDRRLTVWLNAVLHAPQVQAIESAWRSLKFLISHIEFRKGVRLSVLHAPRATLFERLESLLIDPVFDQGADAPDLIALDSQFGNTAPDFEALDGLAQHAASLPAVLLAGVSAAFFGVKNVWQVPTLPPLSNLFDQWQFAKWKSLRGQPYARSLAVIFGRGLLRAPYEPGDSRDLEFTYREECLGEKEMVWASGPIAAACAVAHSVAETGWPTNIIGLVHGRIEGFASALAGKKGDTKFGPTDTALQESRIEELAAVGVNALVGFREHADAIFWNGLTAAWPQRVDQGAFLEISIPYQLFAARLATLLLALKPHLVGMATEKTVPYVTQHVRDWLGEGEAPAEPQRLTVQIAPLDDQPHVRQLAVTVTPPTRILPGDIPVVLGYRL
ncbi:MAG TPA: type VI secretion system contractile sheath large subunit [Phycisphaerae bacterium]|jgi:type VI secretion system protein ImpC